LKQAGARIARIARHELRCLVALSDIGGGNVGWRQALSFACSVDNSRMSACFR
jgi:hypothetical protein